MNNWGRPTLREELDEIRLGPAPLLERISDRGRAIITAPLSCTKGRSLPIRLAGFVLFPLWGATVGAVVLVFVVIPAMFAQAWEDLR